MLHASFSKAGSPKDRKGMAAWLGTDYDKQDGAHKWIIDQAVDAAQHGDEAGVFKILADGGLFDQETVYRLNNTSGMIPKGYAGALVTKAMTGIPLLTQGALASGTDMSGVSDALHPTDRVRQAHDILRGYGHSEAETAAILGGLTVESGPNLDLQRNTKKGLHLGIEQLGDDRLQAYIAKYGHSPENAPLAEQMENWQREWTGSESKAAGEVSRATSMYGAGVGAVTYGGRFERNGDPNAMEKAGERANDYLTAFQNLPEYYKGKTGQEQQALDPAKQASDAMTFIGDTVGPTLSTFSSKVVEASHAVEMFITSLGNKSGSNSVDFGYMEPTTGAYIPSGIAGAKAPVR